MQAEVQWFFDNGCMVLHAIATDERAASSYGLPGVVIGGNVHGPADLPRNVSLHTDDAAVAEWLRAAGYRVNDAVPNGA